MKLCWTASINKRTAESTWCTRKRKWSATCWICLRPFWIVCSRLSFWYPTDGPLPPGPLDLADADNLPAPVDDTNCPSSEDVPFAPSTKPTSETIAFWVMMKPQFIQAESPRLVSKTRRKKNKEINQVCEYGKRLWVRHHSSWRNQYNYQINNPCINACVRLTVINIRWATLWTAHGDEWMRWEVWWMKWSVVSWWRVGNSNPYRLRSLKRMRRSNQIRPDIVRGRSLLIECMCTVDSVEWLIRLECVWLIGELFIEPTLAELSRVDPPNFPSKWKEEKRHKEEI